MRKVKSILVAVTANCVVLIDLNIETVYSVVFISVRAKSLPQGGKQWVADNKATAIGCCVIVDVVEQVI